MSYSPSQPSPAPPLSRASLVICLYSALGLVALVIAAGRGDPDLYRFGAAPHWLLVAGPVAGAAVGLSVAALTRVATRRFAWAHYLYASFRNLLYPLTGREIVILAVASSIGEELLFRGALLPWFGLWWQAMVFALLHVGWDQRGWDRRLIPWTLIAFALGVGFGWLAVWTANLGAPIAAHFLINFLNLRFIVAEPAVLLRGQRPAA